MFDRTSMDYQSNLSALEEMEMFIPMTLRERHCLRIWVHAGHEPETNPWNYLDSDGFRLNFLEAFRLKFGYCRGPWDYWKGPEYEPCWDDVSKRLYSFKEQW